MRDSGSSAGSFLNIYDGPDGSIFYGGNMRELAGDKSVEAERAMHKHVKALPLSLRSVMKKRNPKSLGITFAAFWDSVGCQWKDLTDQDPALRKIMSYPEAKTLYSEPNVRMAKRLASDMENEQALDAFLSILRRVPLTPEMASSIRPKYSSKQVAGPFSWERAKRLAMECGYPIASPM